MSEPASDGDLRLQAYTICTAAAPDCIFTVRTYGGADWSGAAADEDACLDVADNAGGGEVGAGDEEDTPVGDRELGVHLRVRVGPLCGRPVVEADAADPGECLVMIHPFRDSNGRMARALATLVLTRSDIGEPEFSSIEEWLGANTADYYSMLAHTGHGSWQPRPDPHLWVTFNLRAHHMQAQTVARRVSEAGATWDELERLAAGHGLPERALDPMFDAALGYRVRRGGYVKRAGVTDQMATRDLAALASAGILEARRNGRGRYYVAGRSVREIQGRRRSGRKPLHDPYPWMHAKLAVKS